jgi:hypothetical protein
MLKMQMDFKSKRIQAAREGQVNRQGITWLPIEIFGTHLEHLLRIWILQK